MYKFLTVGLVVLFASCAPRKYHYFFESVEPLKADNLLSSTRVSQMNPIASKDLSTPGTGLVVYENQPVVIAAGSALQNDTVPPQGQDSNPYAWSTKEAKKKAYYEKKMEYLQARKFYQQQKMVNWPDNATRKVAVKNARDEMEDAYAEARRAYAATKDKRFDGFAIAGAVLFTIAFACMMYPGAALTFVILGFIASILGLKSRIWGLALGSLMAAGIILSLYTLLSILLAGSE